MTVIRRDTPELDSDVPIVKLVDCPVVADLVQVDGTTYTQERPLAYHQFNELQFCIHCNADASKAVPGSLCPKLVHEFNESTLICTHCGVTDASTAYGEVCSKRQAVSP